MTVRQVYQTRMIENLRIKEVTMSRSLLCVSSITILLISLIVSTAIAQSDIRTEPIHFKTGVLSAVVRGATQVMELSIMFLSPTKASI